MRTASTAERSLLARSSRSRSIMAIMVGTEVRKATRCLRGGLDVALGGELRQQDDGVALVQRRLAHRQAVHVIERRRHQRALAERHRPAHPLADRPEMRIVRQHHALGPARRARRVEEHRRFLGLHLDRRERPFVEERREIRVEGDLGHAVGRQRQARVVADHQLGVAVPDDVGHGLGRQLVVHRHRDHARLHGAEEGEQEYSARLADRMATRSPRFSPRFSRPRATAPLSRTMSP